jgi:hypothetical protein
MQRMSGTSTVEGFLIDWVVTQPEREGRLPVSWLDDGTSPQSSRGSSGTGPGTLPGKPI